MASGFYPRARLRLAAPLLLGVWAAAVVLAPDLRLKVLLALPALLIPTALWTLEGPGRWLIGFFAAAWLLPPLPIPLGNSGPHVCLVFAAVGLLAGVLWASRWSIPKSPLNTALATLFVVLLASIGPAAFDSGAAVAAQSLARVALFGIGVYVFFFTAYGPGSGLGAFASIRGVYWFAVAAALFACVDFYFQFPTPAGFGPQFIWLDSGVYRRAQGLFYEASTLGNFCAFFLVLIAVCFTQRRSESPISRKALLAGGALFFTALVLSYSRASVVSVAVALVVLAWQKRSRLPLRRLALIAASSAAAGAFLVWRVFPVFAETYWLRLAASFDYFLSGNERLLSGRIASWSTLAEWLAAHPWQAFVGIGYKTLPYTNYLGVPVVGDNMYLTLLIETGIAGLAALVWLNIAILRAAARAARKSDAQAAFCGTWILCFWAGQTVQMLSGDLLTYWRVLPVYFFVLALAVRP
ncbi:MAG TPA: O-antigen ligase family protein [Bryobacteraceae bacterium]|nr:O-antigen ligase family protein [Bryobacteraceae bacterium]